MPGFLFVSVEKTGPDRRLVKFRRDFGNRIVEDLIHSRRTLA